MISFRRSLNHWGKLTIACRWFIVVFLSTSASLSLFSQPAQAAAPTRVVQAPEAAAITGVAFNDANANGVRDAGELGVFGVSVAAFIGNAATPAATTTTDANGNYALTVSAARARVEFTGWSAQLQSSLFGPNSGTSVQFVGVPAQDVNLGLFDPSLYCQSTARVLTSCFVFGDNVHGADKDAATVRSFPYEMAGINPLPLNSEAAAKQTGAVYGIAYQRSTHSIFVSAYTKRAASFGPGTGSSLSDGTGTIYYMPFDATTKDAVPFMDLDALMGADVTGANPHTDYLPDAPDFDSGAFDAVGKVALGDLDIGEDDATLWTVNLKNRSLVRIPIGYGLQVPTAAQIGVYAVPAPACPNGVGRPFAIKPFGGLIYVGGVCTAENNGSSADLSAYVYAFNPDTNTWTSAPVLQVPLNYTRGCGDIFSTYSTTCRAGVKGTSAVWNPWRASVNEQFPNGFEDGFTSYPEPMLTDIAFIGTDMVIGLRDRFADQIGYLDPGPFAGLYRNPFQPNNTARYDLKVIPGGDVLRASRVGNAQWQAESNGQGPSFGPSAGANTNEGPGGGEFFWGDRSVIDGATVHDESALGAMTRMPGRNELLVTVSDPFRLFTGGIAWMNETTGERQRAYEIYAPEQVGTFRKTNGMGDVDMLCDSAPIEIGNRVWLDVNRNGVQDADETPIPNVLVKKTDANGVVETAVTGAKGEYYFAAQPGRAYALSIDLDQRALADLVLTLQNADASANGDARDSDAALENGQAVIHMMTYKPGSVNHTYDFGFSPPLKTPQLNPKLVLQKLVNGDDANTPGGPVVTVGSVVTWTYRITNTGNVTLTNVYVTDDKEGLICQGITLAPGQSTTCTKTGVAVAGQYVNTGIVTGTNQINVTELVTATDLAHYNGVQLPLVLKPGIRIKKYTNGFDADVPPGPVIQVGSAVTWTYEVQNTGNVALTNVTVSDDVIGPVTCPKSVLAPGESMLCLKTGVATLGQYRNVGLVNAVNQVTPNESVSAIDASHYVGAQVLPAGLGDYVWLDANRDGLQTPGELPVAGVIVTLYNASGTAIMTTTTNAQGYYSFTQLLPGTYSVGFIPPKNHIFTAQGQDDLSANDSNADATTGRTRTVTLQPGEYNPTIDAGLITTHPAITIKKYVNGDDADLPPGPVLYTTVPVTWTYIITNTGDVTLTQVNLVDDKLGKIICPLTELAPGQSMLCKATGYATTGQYVNLGTVTGYDKLISNCVYPSTCDVVPVTASDAAHYVGATPQLVIRKQVDSAGPAPIVPGQRLTYTLLVTNTGNFTATNVQVSDAVPTGTDYIAGSANPPVASGPNPLVWNLGVLAPNQSARLSFVVRVRNQIAVTAITNQAQAWGFEVAITNSNKVVSVLAQTAVVLTDFRVTREVTGARVAWRTGGEVNTFGFALYRGEGNDRASAVLLNNELIASKGAGATYTFVDANVQPNKAYSYWLVEAETSGALNEYGPAALSAPVAVAQAVVVADGASSSVPVAVPAAQQIAIVAQPQTTGSANVGTQTQAKQARVVVGATEVQQPSAVVVTAQRPAPVAQTAAPVGEPASQQPNVVAAPAVHAEAQSVGVAKVQPAVVEVKAAAQARLQTQAVNASVKPVGAKPTQVETQSQHTGLSSLLIRAIGLAMLLGLMGLSAGVAVFGVVRRRC